MIANPPVDVGNSRRLVSDHQATDKDPRETSRRVGPTVPLTVHARLLVLLIYAMLVAWLVVTWIRSPPASLWIPYAAVLFLAVLVAPVVFVRHNQGLLHPLMYPAIAFVVLGGPLGQWPKLTGSIDRHLFLPGLGPSGIQDAVALEYTMLALGLLAYYFAFWAWGSNRRLQLQPRRTGYQLGHRFWGIPLLLWIFYGGATLVFLVFMHMRGGVVAHLASFAQSREVALYGQFYWVALIHLAQAAVLAMVALDARVLKRPAWWVAAVAAMAMAFLATGSRSGLTVVPLITLLIVMAKTKTVPRKAVGFAVVVAVGLVLLAPTLLEVRQAGGLASDGHFQSPAKQFEKYAEEVRFRASEGDAGVAIVARVPEDFGYRYGATYASLVTLPIPRVLWEEKPGLLDGQVRDTFADSGGAKPPGPVGEIWWNFGPLGIPFVFAAFGILQRGIFNVYLRNPNQPIPLVALTVSLPFLTITSTGLLNYVMIAGPVVLMLVLLQRPSIAISRQPGSTGRNTYPA